MPSIRLLATLSVLAGTWSVVISVLMYAMNAFVLPKYRLPAKFPNGMPKFVYKLLGGIFFVFIGLFRRPVQVDVADVSELAAHSFSFIVLLHFLA